MNWTSRQFMIPIFIGFSLTSVSIALVYLLYKKDDNEYSDGEYVEIGRPKTIECKVPKQFVPAVIGRGGSTIKDIQQKTNTKIYFNEDNIECPERSCSIRGNREGILLAEQMIKSIIANQPVIETYEMYVPQNACGRIIGRAGETVNHIQMSSSAKVIVENYSSRDPNTKRRIIIKGTSEQIAAALSQIEDKVREDKEARLKLEASSALRLPRGKLSPRNTASNVTEQTQSTEHLPLQVVDGLMEVYVSAMESPSQFWIQVVGPGMAALDKLVSEMTAYYNEDENREIHVLSNVTLGQIVAAKFSFDEQWYRAEVISITMDGYCEVYFVDYGDHEMVHVNNILELRTDFLSLRLQAIECSLANIRSRQPAWSSEVCEKFAELTSLAQWKVLLAKVRGYKERTVSYGRTRREGSPIPCVDLYDRTDDKNIDVGQELVNEGLADREETVLSAGSSPTSSSYKIQEIDLRTPEKPVASVEEIDLVTPVKDETSRFIENEKKVHRENSSSDYRQNGSTNQRCRTSNSNLKLPKSARTAPAGYESDLSADSDELELG